MKNNESIWELIDKKAQENNIIDLDAYANGVSDGAKWQAERMYSDMQEYTEFCIECDRKEMPLLLVQDWYEQFKK